MISSRDVLEKIQSGAFFCPYTQKWKSGMSVYAMGGIRTIAPEASPHHQTIAHRTNTPNHPLLQLPGQSPPPE